MPPAPSTVRCESLTKRSTSDALFALSTCGGRALPVKRDPHKARGNEKSATPEQGTQPGQCYEPTRGAEVGSARGNPLPLPGARADNNVAMWQNSDNGLMKKTVSARDCLAKNILIASLLSLLMLFVSSCKQRQSTTTNQPDNSTAQSTPTQQTSPSPAVNTYHGTGVVTKVVRENPYDKTLASVEINHGEIVGLMPAMRMEFYVKERSLLDGIKVGDLIDFTIEEKGSSEIVSEIKKK